LHFFRVYSLVCTVIKPYIQEALYSLYKISDTTDEFYLRWFISINPAVRILTLSPTVPSFSNQSSLLHISFIFGGFYIQSNLEETKTQIFTTHESPAELTTILISYRNRVHIVYLISVGNYGTGCR